MKKLYKQFNKLNIETDVQPMDVNEQEKERVKRMVLKRKKRKPVVRNASVVATFLIASSIMFSFAFPTLAAKVPLVGNLFGLFTENESYVFDKYEAHSTEIGMTSESNGISVTVTDAVYDRENITIAYTIKSDRDLGERPVLEGLLNADEFTTSYKHYGYYQKHITKKISENEYAGLFVYQLIRGPKPEKIHLTWDGNRVQDLSSATNEFHGEWSFPITLHAIEGSTKELVEKNIKSAANGIHIKLKKMTETPLSTTVYLYEAIDIPTVTNEHEEWRGAEITYTITDDLGNAYNMIHYKDLGHSSDFASNLNSPRLTTTALHEDATSLTITPTVHLYKMMTSDGLLKLIKDPYLIEPMHVPLSK